MKLSGSNLAFIFFYILLNISLKAQDTTTPSNVWQEAGLPYIQNFSPKEYRGGTQIFTVAQDERGLMYFGNNWGVLVYDGVSWRLVRLPNQGTVRSLYPMKDRILIGGVGELGYLDTDATGRLHYVSLMARIPEEHRDFKDVYDTFAFEGAVYFRTRHTLFRLSESRTRVWERKEEFGNAFVVNGKLYLRRRNVGLMQMRKDSLHLMPDGEAFAGPYVTTMLPYGADEILIGTFAHGLFLYDGSEIRKFSTSIDDFLYRNQLRSGANLRGGLFAFATKRGAVIIDKAGNLCQMVNKALGLRDELVISMFVDRQDGLWLGLNNGIARVETPAPISRFQDASGIESFVQSIIRHDGRLYTATPHGVSYLDETAFPVPMFKSVAGISSLSWSLLADGKHLLAGTQDGIYEVTRTGAKRINRLSAIRLHRSTQDSSLVFAGLLEGFSALRLSNNAWQNLGRVPGITERIIAIMEDENGTLWLGTQTEGVLNVRFPGTGHPVGINWQGANAQEILASARITRFGKQHGLPAGPASPYRIGTRLVFETRKGLRRFDPAQLRFVPDSTLGMTFADTLCRIGDVREDPRGNIWIVAGTGEENFISRGLPQPDGSYQWQQTPFLRINDLGRVYFSYPEKNGVVWFGGAEGIARYTPDIPKDYHVDYATVIRRVSGISTDSVLYHGAAHPERLHPEIEYQNNSLRFEFAAMSYDDPTANRYQVRLEGFDSDWSSWSNEARKDYTGLPAGDYTFRVRAKNIYEHLSREGVFTFRILPPWYLKWWAWLIYAGGTIGLVGLIVKARVRHLQARTRQLEALVTERTATVREQAEKLEEMDRMKSRFFANISHEFRTPLTLILGPVEDLLEKAKPHRTRESLQRVHRNARRLQRLINQLLDLSRLETGKMTLQAAPGDFIGFLKGVVMSFASLAESKNIELKFEVVLPEPCEGLEPSQGFVIMYFDRDKIEKIFSNLLSNALKFTPEGGEVKVAVAVAGEESAAIIEVSDSGVGIPADRLPHIFDRFFQVDNSATRAHEGTGIGLALVKELVELHHGEIEVGSRVGEGSTFKVTLPLGKAHLREDEIVTSTSEAELASFENLQALDIAETASSHPAPDFDEEATVILIVEDHADVREYLRSHLQADYHIVEAKDGLEGVEIAKEVIPDLVISDVMMPEQDGYALCAALKTDEKTSHIPVILLTARAGEEDKLTGLETGADDYLLKPFNAKELQARVRNLIEQRRKLRQRFIREGMMRPTEVTVTSLDDQFLQKIMATIEARMEDEGFNVEELSQEMNMGPRHLHRKIRALTGKSPVELIRFVRLSRARQLLEQRAGTISEIAYRLGFSNHSYFARVFREEFGKLPSEL